MVLKDFSKSSRTTCHEPVFLGMALSFNMKANWKFTEFWDWKLQRDPKDVNQNPKHWNGRNKLPPALKSLPWLWSACHHNCPQSQPQGPWKGSNKKAHWNRPKKTGPSQCSKKNVSAFFFGFWKSNFKSSPKNLSTLNAACPSSAVCTNKVAFWSWFAAFLAALL